MFYLVLEQQFLIYRLVLYSLSLIIIDESPGVIHTLFKNLYWEFVDISSQERLLTFV